MLAQAALESDEPPEPDPELDELELDELELPELDELELESVLVDEPDEPEELYRSEYQPPPLRMKPPPSEICRLADA